MGNMPTRLVVPDWFTISQGRWLETALFTARGWKPPNFVAEGGGWKTRFISPWQDGILLPIPARGAAG